MPCDTITTQYQSDKLSSAMPVLLAEALRLLGWTLTEVGSDSLTARKGINTVTWAKGRGVSLSLAGSAQADTVMSDIVRGYSASAVSWAASRAGWTAAKTGPKTMTLTRR